MGFLKFIFLLLVAIPFAIFLLFILDRLIDELNHGLPKNMDVSSTEQRVRKRRYDSQNKTNSQSKDDVQKQSAGIKGNLSARIKKNEENRKVRRKKKKERKARKDIRQAAKAIEKENKTNE